MPPYPGTPRWAKIFGAILAIVVIAFFVVLIFHGPHRGGLHG